jgi:hypothetical protein
MPLPPGGITWAASPIRTTWPPYAQRGDAGSTVCVGQHLSHTDPIKPQPGSRLSCSVRRDTGHHVPRRCLVLEDEHIVILSCFEIVGRVAWDEAGTLTDARNNTLVRDPLVLHVWAGVGDPAEDDYDRIHQGGALFYPDAPCCDGRPIRSCRLIDSLQNRLGWS